MKVAKDHAAKTILSEKARLSELSTKLANLQKDNKNLKDKISQMTKLSVDNKEARSK